MFNPQLIETAFLGLAGMRQTENTNFDTFPDSILYDGTNLLITHPLVNPENLDALSKNFDLYPFDAYNALTTYAIGDRVKDVGIVYDSLTNGNIGNTPASSPTDWVVVSLLGLYLEDLFTVAGSEVLNEVMNRKKLNGNTKTLLQNIRLSEGAGSFNDLIVSTGSLVGIEIKMLYRQNLRLILNRIGFQFTANQTNLPIYFYHSSLTAPFATVTINYTATGSLQWVDFTQVLNFLDSTHDAGGLFYIMYDQDDVAGQAIQKKVNFNLAPCGSCNRTAYNNFNLYSKYMYIRTIEVPAADRATVPTDLWDIDLTKYVPDNNFGLNFEFTARCDLTDFIIQQKDVFAYAYRDMAVKKMIEGMAYSTRQNGISEKVMKIAQAELLAEEVGGMGIKKVLDKSLNAVNFEVSQLDSTCMPCNNSTGLRHKSAGLYR